MSTPVLIRPATVADADGMATAHLEAWRVGYRGLLPDEFLDGMDQGRRSAAWVQELSEDDGSGSQTLVASVGGRIAGLSTVGPYRDEPEDDGPADLCELWMLNVHPDYWGSGVAQHLMAEAVELLRSGRPEPRAALWVLDGNARGRRFYEKEGWSWDGGQKHDTIGEATVTELRYVRDL